MPERDLSRKRGESLAKYVRRLGRAICLRGDVTLDYDGGPYAAVRVDGQTMFAAWSASRPLEMLALSMESSAYALETAEPTFQFDEWNPKKTSRNALRSDAPLRFRRRVPFQELGVEVDVTIHPDLTVEATDAEGTQVAIGRFSAGQVTWSHSHAELGATARGMIASDVHDVLDLFRSGILSAESWTRLPAARAELVHQRYSDAESRDGLESIESLYEEDAQEQVVRQLLLAQVRQPEDDTRD